MSRKQRKGLRRASEAADFRRALIMEVGCCEIHGYVKDIRSLAVHEIAGGPNRAKSLDKRFAVLVVCPDCHRDVHGRPAHWSKARQLAVLGISRPKDLDVPAFCDLIGWAVTAITDSEVSECVADIIRDRTESFGR